MYFTEYNEHQLGSTSTIPLQVLNSTDTQRPQSIERNTNFWYILKHNWRQLTSLIPGFLLLCASGSLHISWTIWQLIAFIYEYQEVKTSILIAWYAGTVGGAIFGSFANSKWSKICIYYFTACCLLLISSLFMLSSRNEYNFILFGRTLTGLMYGIILVTIIMHITDNSSQYIRRYLFYILTILNLLPLIIVAKITSCLINIESIHVCTGIIMLILAIFTLIVMPCTYESIVYLLETGKDLKALGILLKIRNESRHFIRQDFNELKVMIAEDYNLGGNILKNGSWKPLLLSLLIRLLSPLLANNLISLVFLMNIWHDYHYQRVSHNGNNSETMSNYTAQCTEYRANETDMLANYEDETNAALLNSVTTTEDYNSTLNNSTELIESTIFNSTDEFTSLTSNPTETNGNYKSNDYEFSTESPASYFNCPQTPDYWFVHSSYIHQLPTTQLLCILLSIFVIKLLFGIPLAYYAEKFNIFRNRFVFKATLIVGILNFIFFAVTQICYAIDDKTLIFTFYMVKLLNIINGTFLIVAFVCDSIGYIELGEAFSLSKRFGSIAFIIIVEHSVNILFIILLMHSLQFYHNFIQSAAVIGICYLLICFMPNESLDQTIRHARDKYFISTFFEQKV